MFISKIGLKPFFPHEASIDLYSAESGLPRAHSEIVGVLGCGTSQPAVQSDDPRRAEPSRRKWYSWLTVPKKNRRRASTHQAV